ncbi:uncharacterized protein [Argopecten irradians]|uniref:uncharacterized protein n=1 Tax=Argopecten irradians TaxID=31199 RepID=UPI00371FD8CD
MTRLKMLWIILMVLPPVLGSLRCNSTCTTFFRNKKVRFPCALLETDEELDAITPNYTCGPNNPSSVICDEEHVNGAFDMGFSWHPPGDSSAKDITGYRILISIPIHQHFYPRRSYYMNLTRRCITDPLTTFTLGCVFDEDEARDKVQINAFVYSLPKSGYRSCNRKPSSCGSFLTALNHTQKETNSTQSETDYIQSMCTDVSSTAPSSVLGIAVAVPTALVSIVLILLAVKRLRRDKKRTMSAQSVDITNESSIVSNSTPTTVTDERENGNLYTVSKGLRHYDDEQTMSQSMYGSIHTDQRESECSGTVETDQRSSERIRTLKPDQKEAACIRTLQSDQKESECIRTLQSDQKESECIATSTDVQYSDSRKDYTQNMDKFRQKSIIMHEKDIRGFTCVEPNVTGDQVICGRIEESELSPCPIHGYLPPVEDEFTPPLSEDEFIPPLSDAEQQRVESRLSDFNQR